MYPKTIQLILTYLQEGVYPGVSYAFINQGKIEQGTYGYAQLEPLRPLTTETLFDMASLTKMIATNSLILQLIESEHLQLDRPLQSYLPQFRDPIVTIRHLLTHTSAINPYIKNRDTLNSEELKKTILSLKSDGDIGQTVTYTDTGTILLGFLLEEIYDEPLHRLFQERVLKPLQMTHSTFVPTHWDIAATEDHPTRGVICGQVHDPKAFVLGQHCGSAGLFSTIGDSLLFAQMILAGGMTANNHPFLQEVTIDSLFADWTPSGTLKRSLGWDLKEAFDDQRPLLFHTGYTGTFMVLDKEAQEAFIFLSNRLHPVDKRVDYLEKRDHILEIYLQEKAQSSSNLL